MDTNHELIRIYVGPNFQFGVEVSWIAFLLVILVVGIFVLIGMFVGRVGAPFEIDEVELGLGEQKLLLRPNYSDIQIAYQLWVELGTRKIAMKFDPENDIILDVYKSWYDFFRVARDLIKEIPAQKLKHKSTRELVRLAMELLNTGLRPHLTKWNGRFVSWYNDTVSKQTHGGSAPQKIQTKYPKYHELVSDMIAVNSILLNYRDMLGRLVLRKHNI